MPGPEIRLTHPKGLKRGFKRDLGRKPEVSTTVVYDEENFGNRVKESKAHEMWEQDKCSVLG